MIPFLRRTSSKGFLRESQLKNKLRKQMLSAGDLQKGIVASKVPKKTKKSDKSEILDKDCPQTHQVFMEAGNFASLGPGMTL